MAGTYELNLNGTSHSSAAAQVIVKDGDLEPVTLSDDGNDMYSYTTPYYSGFDLDPSGNAGNEISYEEYSGAAYIPVLNCGTGRFYPGTDSVRYAITEGAQYASLGDYWTRTVYGNTCSALLGEPIVIANGIAPDSGVAKVVMTASCGGCSVSKTFWIHPYTVRITSDPPVVAWGKEANINVDFINWKNDWMARGTGPLLTFGLMDSLSYGKMWYGRESGDEYGQGDTVYNVQAPLGPNYHFGYSLKFCADGKMPKDTTTIKLFGVKTGEGDLQYARRLTSCPYQGMTQVRGEGEIKVIPGDDYCPAVQFLKTPIYAGDTVDVTVMKKINDTTFAPYPADQLFGIAITDGGIYGKLMNANGDVAQSFDSVRVPIKFIADTTMMDDSAFVTIWGMPIELSSSGQSAAKKKARMLKTNGGCNDPKCTLQIFGLADSIQVTNSLDAMLNTEQVVVKITTFYKIWDENHKKIIRIKEEEPPAGTKCSIWLGSEGHNVVKLKNLQTGVEGEMIFDSEYSDIKNGRVVVTGGSLPPPGRFPIGVRVFVSMTNRLETSVDYGTVFMRTSETSGVRYIQSNVLWAEDSYDHYVKFDKDGTEHPVTVGGVGCALTCMAMILQAYDNNETPKTLNEYMSDNGLFDYDKRTGQWNGNVLCGAISSRDHGFETPLPITENVLQTLSNTVFDGDTYVIAKVNNGAHWVLITSKNSGGYSVIDPAGDWTVIRKKVTLNSYVHKDNTYDVNKIVIVRRKK